MFRSVSAVCVLFLLCSYLEAVNRPELVLQAGHTGSIRAVAISPDARWLVSGSQDSTVKIWNLQSGNLLRTLYGHNGKIRMVAISPDGRWIASCADDGTARIWDVMGGTEVRELTGHSDSVDSVAFAGASQLVTASADVVKIWDTTTGREIRSVKIDPKDRGGRISLSSDGRIFVIGGAVGQPKGGFMGFGTPEVFRPLKVMDISSGKELLSIKSDTGTPFATYALSPDSRLFAIRKSRFKGNQNEESIRVMDVASDREVIHIKIPGNGSAHAVGALTFSGGGKWIAAEGSIETDLKARVYIFDVASGQIVRQLTTSGMFTPGVNLDVVSSVINPLAFSPDNKIIAFGGTASIQLWDAESGKELHALRTEFKAGATTSAVSNPGMPQTDQQSGMTQEDMSRMSTEVEGMMESMGDEESPLSEMIKYAEVIGGKQGMMISRTFADKRLQFSPDGRWLLYEKGKHVGIWDIASGTYNQQLYRITTPVAFSPDGHLFASMEVDPSRMTGQNLPTYDLVIRELPSLKVRSRNSFQEDTAEELSFAPDGSWLAVKSRSATGNDVRIVDANSGKQLRNVLLGDSSGITNTVFSADGRYVAFGGHPAAAGSVPPDVFTMSGMPMPQKMDKKQIEKMQKEMEKQMKALSGALKGDAPTQPSPYEVRIIDLQNGQTIRTLGVESSLPQQGEQPAFGMTQEFAGEDHRFVFSKDGTLLAIEDKEQQIPAVKVYEVTSGRHISTIRVSAKPAARPDPANPYSTILAKHVRPNFAFSADGKFLAVTMQEGGYAVKLYDAFSGQVVHTMPHNNRVDAASFDGSGRFLSTMMRDGSLCLWDIRSGRLLATLMEFPGMYFSTEWLVATPDGLFDGSPAAWNQILWRFSQNTFDLAPVETFFNDLYYPGLLTEIFSDKPPQAPRDISQLDRRQPKVQLVVNAKEGSERNLTVRLTIAQAVPDASHSTPGGAKDVRLFRNGSLVHVWRGDVLNGQSTVTLETTVPIVAGENQFVAYAFNNDNVKSQDSFVRVKGAETLRRSGVAYILAIGIDQYANSDFNLKYAVADAQAFTQNLSQAQTKLAKYSKVEVVSLFDQEASKATILGALQKMQSTEPEDAVFLYYAGHGTAEDSRFYMIPHDLGYAGSRSDLGDSGLKSILANSISDQDLERYFERIGAGHVLFVIDACNSGQALEAEERRRGPMNAKGLAQLAYEKGMYVLAAAQGYQAALEAAKLGHGYLTYALVEEGIKTTSADSRPADGEVVVREWLDYAANRVPEMQMEKMSEGRLLKHEVAFVDGEEKIENLAARSVQQPRVFYRRESELQPMVILKP